MHPFRIVVASLFLFLHCCCKACCWGVGGFAADAAGAGVGAGLFSTAAAGAAAGAGFGPGAAIGFGTEAGWSLLLIVFHSVGR